MWLSRQRQNPFRVPCCHMAKELNYITLLSHISNGLLLSDRCAAALTSALYLLPDLQALLRRGQDTGSSSLIMLSISFSWIGAALPACSLPQRQRQPDMPCLSLSGRVKRFSKAGCPTTR